MKWHAAFAVTIVCLAGCHAPQPSFDLLAPYGPSRVPSPSTGSHGTGGAYYNRTAPPTSLPGAPRGPADPATSQKMQSKVSNTSLTLGDSWKPIRTAATPEAAPVFRDVAGDTASPILPASYNGTANGGTVRANTGRHSSSTASLRLKGMPVTDATQRPSLSEPGKFRPPGGAIPMSQLSRPAGTSSQRGSVGTVVSSAKSSDGLTPASRESSTSKTTLNWLPPRD